MHDYIPILACSKWRSEGRKQCITVLSCIPNVDAWAADQAVRGAQV